MTTENITPKEIADFKEAKLFAENEHQYRASVLYLLREILGAVSAKDDTPKGVTFTAEEKAKLASIEPCAQKNQETK